MADDSGPKYKFTLESARQQDIHLLMKAADLLSTLVEMSDYLRSLEKYETHDFETIEETIVSIRNKFHEFLEEGEINLFAF